MLLGRFRQMAANFGEESRCGDEYQAATVVVAGGQRDSFGELACELFDGVLLVAAPSLQTRSSRARTASAAAGSHHHAAGSIGPEIAIVSSRERIFQGLARARGRARLAEFEYGGMPRVGDENGIATHRGDLRTEAF